MKKVLFVICSVVMMFTLTGCMKKEKLSTRDFIDIVEKNDCITADVASQFSSYDYVEQATIAKCENNWQIEFYVLEDNSYAKGMFENNKKIFEDLKVSMSTEASTNLGNSSTYSLTSNGYYMYLSKIENTLLYVKVKDTYKDNVKELVKELGY